MLYCSRSSTSGRNLGYGNSPILPTAKLRHESKNTELLPEKMGLLGSCGRLRRDKLALRAQNCSALPQLFGKKPDHETCYLIHSRAIKVLRHQGLGSVSFCSRGTSHRHFFR